MTAALVATVILTASGTARADVCRVTQFSNGITHGHLEGIAAGPDGNMWFTEAGGGGAIARITPQGQVTEFTSGITQGAPQGITAGPDGNMWFTESGGVGAVGRITPQGQITEFTQGITSGNSPAGITAGPDGILWFTEDGDSGTIGRITPQGAVGEFTGGTTEFTQGITRGSPEGIAAGPDRNLWFTESRGAGAVARITPSGTVTEFPSGGDASEITAGPAASMWFTESNGRIGRITPGGRVSAFSRGITPNSLPRGIARGADGNLWFTEERAAGFTSGAIARITPHGQVTEFSFSPNLLAWDIAAGPGGNMWFTEFGGRVGRIAAGCRPIGGGHPPAAPAAVLAPRHKVSGTKGFTLEVTLHTAQVLDVKVYEIVRKGKHRALSYVGLLSVHGTKGMNRLRIKLVHGHKLMLGSYQLVVYTVNGVQSSKASRVTINVGRS
jgi:streptogramin lyase